MAGEIVLDKMFRPLRAITGLNLARCTKLLYFPTGRVTGVITKNALRILHCFCLCEVVSYLQEIFERSEEEVVSVVRRQLCPSLKALLEHGMLSQTVVQRSLPSSLGVGCFVASKSTPLEHIWDVVLFFYDSKNGRELSEAPVRKLSQSFKLENVAGKTITSKQVLLTTIENIVSTHARLRRSKDAQWKAFVSAAMNEKKLPAWLRIIFRSRYVVEMCYNSWSYVARTGNCFAFDLSFGYYPNVFDGKLYYVYDIIHAWTRDNTVPRKRRF
ncbi:unnamed protein product [Heligmosomoides polygyrus]|uniref:RUN domain-containing protein n=1 Tax=Heligmosomoides polygyrus TaxID=6339 RepID=A0A3P8BIG8_HELPZ|nr:unnamed protein product [Heligmosomoides polygyrus]